MLAKVHSCTVIGIDGLPLEIEIDISDGLPVFDIIGLPDASVREAKERVRSAVRNSGFQFPYSRITVNLAPAEIKKEGSSLDLPIAIALLAATGQIPRNEMLANSIFVGELSLDGNLRPVNGILAMVLSLANMSNYKNKSLYLPVINCAEAALVKNMDVRGAVSLKQIADYFCGNAELPATETDQTAILHHLSSDLDYQEVRGQESAKRALEIAAAGAHNLLLYGPPGSGKTMLARRIPTILPPPTLDEVLAMTRIHSVAGLLNAEKPVLTTRPFRSPHHSASKAGIIGGGRMPKPGEVSLAHFGVLFFDELPEYNREILEALRQPLEDSMVTVTRVSATVTYPADFMFVGSMNPCPCGNYGDPGRLCRCDTGQLFRYRAKLSGPLLDRIDIQVEVPGIKYEQLENTSTGESSAQIRQRVIDARNRQAERYRKLKINNNAQLKSRHFEHCCILTEEAKKILRLSFQNLKMSMRAHDRIIKVARTVADLAGAKLIEAEHLAEAVQYRNLDRQE